MNELHVWRKPLFVYGTLVPKQGFQNFDKVLASRVNLFPPSTDLSTKSDQEYTSATTRNYKIYHLQGFPACTPSSNQSDVVTGALVWPSGDKAAYQATIVEADRLEKYYGQGDPNNEYQRVEVTTTMSNGELVQAWMYECLLDLDTCTAQQVESGNWPLFMKENNFQDSGDDWSELHATTVASSKTT